jgi:molybdate-binding protein/DNA-binding XRE family transcriptional regulator
MESRPLQNSLRERRASRGWTQEDLGRRAGISRAEVSSIETGRLIPSASVALSLGSVFGCPVEEIFTLGPPGGGGVQWAWEPAREPCRVWKAEVAGRTLLYPVETTSLGTLAHDGLHPSPGRAGREEPGKTLVVAGCDPAVGLLASAYGRRGGFRLLPLTRSSRAALELLGERCIHVAGVHLGGGRSRGGNERAVRELLGAGYRLLRLARWQEGVAVRQELGLRTVRAAVRTPLRWVAREEGSGARRCLDRLLEGKRPARSRRSPLARDHRGVAEAVRSGWAQAGVCVRLCAEEAGLRFLSVELEDYDLSYPAELAGDPRIKALVETVRSVSYRRTLGELEGYDSRTTGEVQGVR